jgi:hypothetical protein
MLFVRVCVCGNGKTYIHTRTQGLTTLFTPLSYLLFQLGSGQVLQEPVFPLLILPIYQRR